MIESYHNFSSEQFITLIEEKENRITKLEEELAWLKKQVFGKKSEKRTEVIAEQPPLIPLDQIETLPQKEESEKIKVEYERSKKKVNENHPGRNKIPAHIERVTIDIHPEGDLSDKELVGTQVREVLERIPAKFIVKRYVIHIYKNKSGKFFEGKMPSLPIEKGIPGPGLLAFVLVNKFVYHLPLHRQLEIFKNEAEMIIKASTISGWVGQCCQLLLILYDKLLEKVLAQSYLMVDETPIKVLMKQGSKKIILGYFWVYYSPLTKTVFFDYRSGRGAQNPSYRLKNFKGHIQTDGFIAYKNLPNDEIQLLNCMAHARRKFVDAKTNNAALADYFIKQAEKLYRVEKRAKAWKLSFEDRYQFRLKRSQPVLNDIKTWLDERKNENHPPSLKISEAINYTLNHWRGLIRYLEDGKFEIDNNPVERAIRPVAVGRKNYLFAGSEEGAKHLAMMYSFFGTCKAQDIEPYEWMKNTLEKMPDYDAKFIDELLPLKIS